MLTATFFEVAGGRGLLCCRYIPRERFLDPPPPINFVHGSYRKFSRTDPCCSAMKWVELEMFQLKGENPRNHSNLIRNDLLFSVMS